MYLFLVVLSMYIPPPPPVFPSQPMEEACLSSSRRVNCALRYGTKIGRPILVYQHPLLPTSIYRHLRILIQALKKRIFASELRWFRARSFRRALNLKLKYYRCAEREAEYIIKLSKVLRINN